MIFRNPDLTGSFVLLVDQHKVLVAQFWYFIDDTLNITYAIDSTIAGVFRRRSTTVSEIVVPSDYSSAMNMAHSRTSSPAMAVSISTGSLI
jgi:hypothetical protein